MTGIFYVFVVIFCAKPFGAKSKMHSDTLLYIALHCSTFVEQCRAMQSRLRYIALHCSTVVEQCRAM